MVLAKLMVVDVLGHCPSLGAARSPPAPGSADCISLVGTIGAAGCSAEKDDEFMLKDSTGQIRVSVPRDLRRRQPRAGECVRAARPDGREHGHREERPGATDFLRAFRRGCSFHGHRLSPLVRL